MSEINWLICFFLASALGIILRIGTYSVSKTRTPRMTLVLLISGLGALAIVQWLILYVTLLVVQLADAIVPAWVAVGLADLIALGVILLCFFTRRKRHLTDAQKIELSEL